ncbi:hypothetical protein J6590_022399 [Homalodisca vitripennis]|nr:hypothetical protein J6590_022399 [Homalodisca vitripennis]
MMLLSFSLKPFFTVVWNRNRGSAARRVKLDPSRFQTQPVTQGEVEEAKRVSASEATKPSSEGEDDPNDPSKLSLAERVQLFNRKMVSERGVLRSARYKTQPVTPDELEKAQRLTPISRTASSVLVSGILKNLTEKNEGPKSKVKVSSESEDENMSEPPSPQKRGILKSPSQGWRVSNSEVDESLSGNLKSVLKKENKKGAEPERKSKDLHSILKVSRDKESSSSEETETESEDDKPNANSDLIDLLHKVEAQARGERRISTSPERKKATLVMSNNKKAEEPDKLMNLKNLDQGKENYDVTRRIRRKRADGAELSEGDSSSSGGREVRKIIGNEAIARRRQAGLAREAAERYSGKNVQHQSLVKLRWRSTRTYKQLNSGASLPSVLVLDTGPSSPTFIGSLLKLSVKEYPVPNLDSLRSIRIGHRNLHSKVTVTIKGVAVNLLCYLVYDEVKSKVTQPVTCSAVPRRLVPWEIVEAFTLETGGRSLRLTWCLDIQQDIEEIIITTSGYKRRTIAAQEFSSHNKSGTIKKAVFVDMPPLSPHHNTLSSFPSRASTADRDTTLTVAAGLLQGFRPCLRGLVVEIHFFTTHFLTCRSTNFYKTSCIYVRTYFSVVRVLFYKSGVCTMLRVVAEVTADVRRELACAHFTPGVDTGTRYTEAIADILQEELLTTYSQQHSVLVAISAIVNCIPSESRKPAVWSDPAAGWSECLTRAGKGSLGMAVVDTHFSDPAGGILVNSLIDSPRRAHTFWSVNQVLYSLLKRTMLSQGEYCQVLYARACIVVVINNAHAECTLKHQHYLSINTVFAESETRLMRWRKSVVGKKQSSGPRAEDRHARRLLTHDTGRGCYGYGRLLQDLLLQRETLSRCSRLAGRDSAGDHEPLVRHVTGVRAAGHCAAPDGTGDASVAVGKVIYGPRLLAQLQLTARLAWFRELNMAESKGSMVNILIRLVRDSVYAPSERPTVQEPIAVMFSLSNRSSYITPPDKPDKGVQLLYQQQSCRETLVTGGEVSSWLQACDQLGPGRTIISPPLLSGPCRPVMKVRVSQRSGDVTKHRSDRCDLRTQLTDYEKFPCT